MELICKNIQSDDKSLRQAALRNLSEMVARQTIDEDLKNLLDQTYLHLVKCYADRFESIRSLAVSVVSQFLASFQMHNEFFLNYIVPTIRRRIGLPELIEQSEELQLQLLEQVYQIIDRFRSTDEDRLMRAYNDIIDIVARNLINRYADANKQSCRVIRLLATVTRSFYMRAESLVDPLIQLLNHRQSPSRIESVETLGVVCLYVTNKNDKIVQSIISISPLLTDSVPAVRRMCGLVGCKWLMELPDRYSFFDRIVPLVLCCLKDDFTEIREEINAQFVRCGEKYFEENEKDLQRVELIDSDLPCTNYVETVAKQRPTLGCRALVQRSLRMVDIIVKETLDWKESVRLHSLKLLWEVVMFAEKAFAGKFMQVFPILAKACQDDERSVVKEAQRVAFLMGRLLNYVDWMGHALKELKRCPTSLGLLRCFNSLFAGSDVDCKQTSVEDIAMLISTSEICHNLNETYQTALLDLIEQMISLHSVEIKSFEQNELKLATHQERYLFEILVKTIALANAHENNQVKERGMQLYDTFYQTPERRTILQGKYMKGIVEAIEDLDCEHTERSERILMLCGCIELSGFQIEYFDSVQSAIQMVLQNSTANAQIKVLSSVALAFLNWNHQNMRGNSVQILTDFTSIILEPLLIWKAGRNAESTRAIATQVLYSIADTCPTEAAEILPKLAKQLICLVEDDFAVTRSYAVRCAMNSGPLLFQDYRAMMIALLSRLDDPCAAVRIFAVECLSKLKVNRNDEHFCQSSESNLVETVISRLFLYLDDPYVKLRPILLNTLTTLAEKHRDVFEKEVNKLPEDYLYREEINKLMTNCVL